MVISNSIKSFIKSSAIFTGASIFVNLLGYAFHVFAGRYLGPANYSDITTILAYATILTVPVTVLSVVVIKRVGRHTNKSLYLRSLLAYFDSLSHSVPVLVAIYLTLSSLGYLNHLSSSTILLMPIFVITFVFAQLYAVLLQAGKLFSPLSLTITLTGILKLAGALLTPFFPFATPILLLLIISNLSQIWLSRRYLLSHFPTSTGMVKEPLFSLRDPALRLTFVSILGLILLNNLDIVLAKQFLTASEAGVYGVWSLFGKAITFSFIPLASVALVFFADKESDHNPLHILYPSIIFLVICGTLAYFVFYLLSNFMVTTLMGAEFAALIPLLPRSAIFGTVCSLIYLINNYYLSQSSKLAYLPAIITLIILVTLSALGNNLYDFTRLITVGTGISLLIYPVAILARSLRTL